MNNIEFLNDDGEEPKFMEARKVKKSRKIHVCTECESEIPIGSSYERIIAKFEDPKLEVFRTCPGCEFARNYFFKDYRYYFLGDTKLWDMIFLNTTVVPEECLSKLTGKFRDKVFDLIEKEWKDEELNNE